MNAPVSSLRRRLTAALALSLTALCVARADRPDVDALVPLLPDARVTRGMHRDDVVLRLGQPDEKVSTGMWVYWDFRVRNRPAGDGLDTLVIFFAKDRVSWLRLTERKATIALLHQLRLQQAAAVIASAGR